MKRFFLGSLIVLLAFTLLSCTSNADSKSSKETKVESTSKKNVEVKWLSFDEGLKKARAEKKPMLVDFYTDWCHWCKVLDEKTFQDPAVAKKLAENYVTVRIDAEDGTKTANYKGQVYTNIELTRAFQVTGFPSLGFFETTGEPITIVPGFVPPETFINILGYIEGECYKKKISFEDYLKKKEECKK
jgi:thioredoxin-related protein